MLPYESVKIKKRHTDCDRIIETKCYFMKRIYFLLLPFIFTASAFSQQNTFQNSFNHGATAANTFDNFNADVKGNFVRLSWSALSEQNMSSHEIEKSANGSSFTSIGTVAAENDAAPFEYTFSDATPAEGPNYYRIRSSDRFGNISFSKIIQVDNSYRKTDFAITPNPIKGGVVNMQLSNFRGGQYNIALYSNAGQKVFTRTMNFSEGSLTETINLPANIGHGLYFMQVTDGISRINKEVIVQ